MSHFNTAQRVKLTALFNTIYSCMHNLASLSLKGRDIDCSFTNIPEPFECSIYPSRITFLLLPNKL